MFYNFGKNNIIIRFTEKEIEKGFIGMTGDVNTRGFIATVITDDGLALNDENIDIRILIREENRKGVYESKGAFLDGGKYKFIVPNEVFRKSQTVDVQFAMFDKEAKETLLSAVFKREINRSLLDNIKLVKDKINETIVRGGGIPSKSLSELPNNIKNTINNQTRIETGEINKAELRKESFYVDINLNFTPSKVLVALIQKNYFESGKREVLQGFADSNINNTHDSGYADIYDKRRTTIWITEVSELGFKINTDFLYRKTDVLIKWYAIE